MNKNLRTTERFSPRARGIWRTSTRVMLAISLLSILSAAWGEPGPNDGVGILGTITHVCQDAYETDDESANAGTLTAGSPQDHSFDGDTFMGVSDKDWVKFQVTSSGVYTLTASSLSAQADTAIALYSDPYGAALAGNDDAGGALGKGSQIVWSAPNTGWYYLEVYYGSQSTAAFEDCGGTLVQYRLSLEAPTTKFLYLPIIMR